MILKNHPQGLLVAFFTNMGERFGFYTMMAILVLFLQVKYGLSENDAGEYYSWFYFAIYALSLLGGTLADWKKQYKSVILWGQIIMFFGYLVLTVPSISLWGTLIALFIISLGNGFFKGNLQAVVGQLYDDEKYAKHRDSAFMIFYIGINIGAFFAPFVATGVRNWWLKTHGFIHDGSLPALCHQQIAGTLTNPTELTQLANAATISPAPITDLNAFAYSYLDVFAKGYNWAFGIAAGAMILSILIYTIFYKTLPNRSIAKAVTSQADAVKNTASMNNGRALAISLMLMAFVSIVVQVLPLQLAENSTLGLGLALGLFVAFIAYILQISTRDERPRVTSLIFVFVVVVFFWMSFHQNGLTLTFFARDYIAKDVGAFTYLFFNLESIICVIATIIGFILLVRNNSKFKERVFGGILTLLFGAACYYFIHTAKAENPISPEIFQSFNPLFIVALTPLVMGLFTLLSKKGIEPSVPKKIGFGMIIAGLAFVILLIASLDLVSPYLLGGSSVPETSRVSPYWLMSSYFILTIAELFLSPMGLSFVSKVAPPRFQGLMQGGWLLATAVGNKLLFVGSFLWSRIDLYLLWGIFFICCVVSAILIFSMMKRLEKATK